MSPLSDKITAADPTHLPLVSIPADAPTPPLPTDSGDAHNTVTRTTLSPAIVDLNPSGERYGSLQIEK